VRRGSGKALPAREFGGPLDMQAFACI